MRLAKPIALCCALTAIAAAPVAAASGATASGQTQASATSGGAEFVPGPGPLSTPQHPVVRGFKAKIVGGLAYAPSYAPIQVQRAIWAGDAIRHKPYIYGGGHGAWISSGYDCSGSVSYVLHAAGLLRITMDSSDFMGWGARGLGHWITVYTNPAHAFVQIAGIRFDTSREQDPHPAAGTGPRWRPLMRGTGGFMARHPAGF